MTSSPPPLTDERPLALPDEHEAPAPGERPAAGVMPLALIWIVILLFSAAAWTLLAAGG